MRQFLLLILICAAGFYIYEIWLNDAPPIWSPLKTPDQIAWKEVNKYSNGKEMVLVALVDGNRWRSEARLLPSPHIYVCICDGARTVTSDPKVVDLGAASPKENLEKNYSSFRNSKPARSADLDGHACWIYADTPEDFVPGEASGECWIDKQTRFPLLQTISYKRGNWGEGHLQLLKSDFSILENTCLNTQNLTPIMGPLLNP